MAARRAPFPDRSDRSPRSSSGSVLDRRARAVGRLSRNLAAFRQHRRPGSPRFRHRILRTRRRRAPCVVTTRANARAICQASSSPGCAKRPFSLGRLLRLRNAYQEGSAGRRTMPEALAYSAYNRGCTRCWLAARAEGIGAGWVSILEPEVVSAALDVPAEWKLISLPLRRLSRR